MTEACPSLEGAGWLAGGGEIMQETIQQRVTQNQPCRTQPHIGRSVSYSRLGLLDCAVEAKAGVVQQGTP